MTNSIERARRHAVPDLLPQTTRPARVLARRLAALATWARLTNNAPRLGEADVVSPLDRQSRSLLWYVLTETISTIGVLAPAGLPRTDLPRTDLPRTDLPPAAGLAALAALADNLRERVASAPPRDAAAANRAEPLQIVILEILLHDLQRCLGRWQPRLDLWRDSGRRAADWPLLGLWQSDLGRTRERLIERGWQLGIFLGLRGLDRLLPERAAEVPELIGLDELVRAEATAAEPPDPALIEAGWHIYVEAATRLPTAHLQSGSGVLGEAIAALDALADEVRATLKKMPCPRANSGTDTMQALAFALLSEGIQPFLSAWRPRYRRFLNSERPEAKWRRADECRAALMATRERCRPTIEAIGRKIGAPPFPPPGAVSAGGEETPPLQLPPPAS